jgi:hypothetical protein
MREATFYSLAALLEGPAHGYAILERVKQLSSGHVRSFAGGRGNTSRSPRKVLARCKHKRSAWP